MAKSPDKSKTKDETGDEVFTPPPRPEIPSKDGRSHRATYAKDKMKGGYLIRIDGPQAPKLGRRWVPVTRIDNSENMEFTMDLIWSGTDENSGKPVALFSMWKAPKQEEDEIPF